MHHIYTYCNALHVLHMRVVRSACTTLVSRSDKYMVPALTYLYAMQCAYTAIYLSPLHVCDEFDEVGLVAKRSTEEIYRELLAKSLREGQKVSFRGRFEHPRAKHNA